MRGIRVDCLQESLEYHPGAFSMNSLNFYLKRWNLYNPRDLAVTPTSHVYLVSSEYGEAVLKILSREGEKSERNGALALQRYGGKGAVSLLRADEGAHLTAFVGNRSLKDLVVAGEDESAARIICQVSEKLHSYSGDRPLGLPSIKGNFEILLNQAKGEPIDSVFRSASRVASHLLDSESEPVLLHGDLHHENILYSEENGWLAIDPKGLIGERTYDFANAFYNPEGLFEVVESVRRIERLSAVFSDYFSIDQGRVLEFAFAYGALSAWWAMEDGLSPEPRLRVASVIYSLL